MKCEITSDYHSKLFWFRFSVHIENRTKNCFFVPLLLRLSLTAEPTKHLKLHIKKFLLINIKNLVVSKVKTK